MPTAHQLPRPHGHRRGGPRSMRLLAVLLVAVLLVTVGLSACAPGATDGTPAPGTLVLGDERIALEVEDCATIGGRFAPSLPVEGAETTMVATGRTADDEPVGVLVRRTRSAFAPHVVQSVEIGLGDPERSFEALVLYRALDEDTGRWTSIDPDAPSSRVTAVGPLLALDGGRIQATGIARRAGSGTPVEVALHADCPVRVEPGPGLAHPG